MFCRTVVKTFLNTHETIDTLTGFDSLTGMDHLAFLNRLMENKLALNPARVLIYIDQNPGCKQCEMFTPLKMSRAVLSQCCNLLINKEMIYQEGSYVSKTHNMRRKGIEILTKIKNEHP